MGYSLFIKPWSCCVVCLHRKRTELCASATITFRSHGLWSVHQALVILCCLSAQKENSALWSSCHYLQETWVMVCSSSLGYTVLFVCTEREHSLFSSCQSLPSGDMFIKPWWNCVVLSAQKENTALRKSLDHDVEEREVEIRTLRSDNKQLKKQLIKLVRWAVFLDHDLVSVFVSFSFPFQQCVFFQGSAGIVLSCLVRTVFDADGLSGGRGGGVCNYICVCVWLWCFLLVA